MWMHTSFCRELIVLQGACVWSLDTYFNLSLINHLYVIFVESLYMYQARFCVQISYPAILFTMLMGFLNLGSFIVHALLLGTSKAFTLSGLLPGACVHVLLPGTHNNFFHTVINLFSKMIWPAKKEHNFFNRVHLQVLCGRAYKKKNLAVLPYRDLTNLGT